MKTFIDYYEVLEVRENASDEVIKMAYKALALKYHPDRNGDNSIGAHNKMQIINEAYTVLSNLEMRKKYDKKLLMFKKMHINSNQDNSKETDENNEYEHKKNEREKEQYDARKRAEQKVHEEEKARQDEVKRRAEQLKKEKESFEAKRRAEQKRRDDEMALKNELWKKYIDDKNKRDEEFRNQEEVKKKAEEYKSKSSREQGGFNSSEGSSKKFENKYHHESSRQNNKESGKIKNKTSRLERILGIIMILVIIIAFIFYENSKIMDSSEMKELLKKEINLTIWDSQYVDTNNVPIKERLQINGTNSFIQRNGLRNTEPCEVEMVINPNKEIYLHVIKNGDRNAWETYRVVLNESNEITMLKSQNNSSKIFVPYTASWAPSGNN